MKVDSQLPGRRKPPAPVTQGGLIGLLMVWKKGSETMSDLLEAGL